MRIGELAKAARCTTATIRFYEKKGLLPAAYRMGNRYRSYGPLHVARLRFIRNCHSLDMTHDEIQSLLTFIAAPLDSCGAINALLDAHIGHVDARIEELMNLKTQLAQLRSQCRTEQRAQNCGILHGLAAMDIQATRQTHLG